jgi:predicted nucleic acid-binding protein
VKALLDSDVLIDFAIDREPFVVESDAVLVWCEKHPGSGVVAWHTVANFYYIVRKELGGPSTRKLIQDLLEYVDVISTGTAGIRYALTSPITDFEDAMQAAAAVSAEVDYIITRNTPDFSNSPIPAISPADFLALLTPELEG